MSDHAPPVTQPADIETADMTERADLDRIERELRDVETTLAQLADGTYWSDAHAPADSPDD